MLRSLCIVEWMNLNECFNAKNLPDTGVLSLRSFICFWPINRDKQILFSKKNKHHFLITGMLVQWEKRFFSAPMGITFKVNTKWKFLIFYMKVQEKLERNPLTFSQYLSSLRDMSVQRSVKWHQKWFTKMWPIIKILALNLVNSLKWSHETL